MRRRSLLVLFGGAVGLALAARAPAKVLGLTARPALLARVDEVIE
jgi:hypothetical protein